MATDTYSQPSTNWGRRQPLHAAQRDNHYDYNSPPRTPTRRPLKGPTAAITELKVPRQIETFLNDLTPIEPPRLSESGDERDPHDLSLPAKHVTRTSVVDNMLLSLDQFLPSSPEFDQPSTFVGESADDAGYGAAARYIARPRHRGHTFSSSMSSERDVFLGEQGNYYSKNDHHPYPTSQAPPVSRRLDGIHTSYGQQRLGRANGADSRSQRDLATYHNSNGSASSSLEHGQRYPGRRLSKTGRRSASLDQITGGLLIQNFQKFLGEDDLDAAPTPNVPAGPRRNIPQIPQDPSIVAHFPPPPRTPALSRRNSTKSAKSVATRKTRTDTLGTNILRGHHNEPLPPLPHPYIEPPAPSPTVSYQKPSFPPPEPTPVKERPGFFRRVFGGSSKNHSSPNSYDSRGSATPIAPILTDHNGQVATDRKQFNRSMTATSHPQVYPSIHHEIHQPPTKKASFFRRRKKSISGSAAPPLNLQLSNLKTLDQPLTEASPATSLRRVMDPFLLASADYNSVNYTTHDMGEDPPNGPSIAPERSRRWDDDNHSTLDMPTERPDIPGKSSMRNIHGLQLSLSNTRNPSDSFLTDSSENEDPNTKPGLREPASQFSGEESPRPHTCPDPHHRLRMNEETSRLELNDKSTGSITPRAGDRKVGTFLTVSVSPRDLLAQEAMPRRGSNEHLDSNSPAAQLDSTLEVSTPKTPGIDSPQESNSDVSFYHTASNTPLTETAPPLEYQPKECDPSNVGDVRSPSVNLPGNSDREVARKIFENAEEVAGDEPAAAWLGSPERALIRQAYMELFDWKNLDILASLRAMCSKLVLKGETQQVDRVLDAFSTRWCECNPRHGFKAVGQFFFFFCFGFPHPFAGAHCSYFRIITPANIRGRRRPHHLLLTLIAQYRSSRRRYRAENESLTVHPQYDADHFSCCLGCCSECF